METSIVEPSIVLRRQGEEHEKGELQNGETRASLLVLGLECMKPASERLLVYKNRRIAIVGGGISALLLARRLKLRMPAALIDLYEQEDRLGGRLTCRDATLRLVSTTLTDFWDQSVRYDPESEDIFQLTKIETLEAIGIAIQGKVIDIARSDLFSQTTIKALSNRQVAQHWEHFITATSNKKCKSFLDRMYLTTLNKLAPLLGIPDLSNIPISTCHQHISAFTKRKVLYADWQPALDKLAHQAEINVRTACPVGSANRNADNKWTIVSKAGEFDYDILVAAQPLWSVENWLDKKYLDCFALKKEPPVSSLCIGIAAGQTSLPTCLLIANDNTVAMRAGDMYVLSIRLTFEISLQTPRVLQALGKLKRAARFLQKIDARIKAEPLWVALMPAACITPVPLPAPNASLFFCGDNYGTSNEDSDSNIVESTLYTVDCIAADKSS